jgi:Ca2+-binding EF-hand superfamily protein
MKPILTTIAALAVGAAFATAAGDAKSAEAAKPVAEKPKRDLEEIFKTKDTNSDGFISKEEFLAGAKNPEMAERVFKKKDTNGDGKLSKEEFMTRGKK